MIANLIAETFKGIWTLVAQKPWKINKMHYIISLNHFNFSDLLRWSEVQTFIHYSLARGLTPMPVWIFPSFFLPEPKSQRGEAPMWFSFVWSADCYGENKLALSFFWWRQVQFHTGMRSRKKTAGWLSGKHYLPFSSCMIFAFVGWVEGRLRDPSPVWTLAKNLTSPSYTNWECDTRRYAAFWMRRFSSQYRNTFSPLCYTPSSKGNTCHGTWKGRCLGVRTSVGLPQRAQLQQMIGSADDQR